MSEPKITLEEITDPVEIARARALDEQFRRNSDWLETHWADVLPQARGKFLVVAGQEAFIAETSEEAWLLAEAAHPEDNGSFVYHVRAERGPRIYGNRGQMVGV
jgi:hypothetical protein